MARPHRFSAWDGTQDPLGPDVDELFDRLSEDVFQGWDFDSALRRLLSQGWRDREGRRLAGLEEMTEELRRRRQQQLQRHHLEGIFDDVEEKLNRVLRLERRGIEARLAEAHAGPARRVMERVAASRRAQLDGLPPQPARMIRSLHDYEFMDGRAEQAFAELVEGLRQTVVDSHIRRLSERLRTMGPEEMSRLRDMARDLNALLQQRLEGAPAQQLERSYRKFVERWGSMFPGAPATFDEFLEQLQRQLAALDSLHRSLSPEMRHELEELIAASLGDPALESELAELAASLELLSPRAQVGRRHAFQGGEQVSLEAAMGLMDELASIEDLERAIRSVYQGGEIDPSTEAELTAIMGESMSASLAGLQELTRELERRGIVERRDGALHLTARGMRRIGQKALDDLFSRLERDRFGDHRLAREGRSGERGEQSKPYEFGDAFDLDVERTVMNGIRRQAAEGTTPEPSGRLALAPGDFEVHRSESLTRSATVLMLDMSRSMPLRGYFYAAKKVALALDALIRSQYPRDTLHVVGFARCGQEISSAALPQLSVDEYVYGTNLQHALRLARRLLARHKGGNRQVIIVTDGEPTAHHDEAGEFVFRYPPRPETIQRTLVEVARCTREGIRINTFMLESNHRLVEFVNRMTQINRGRAFFISPERLGDYILVDYVTGRRRAA